MMLETGDRVITPLGPGKVQYARMAPPSFIDVWAYSVLLDHKVKASQEPPFPKYAGTIFPAEDIRPE